MSPRLTVVVAPHPDDELIRGAGYVNWATHRGDRMVLVAVTDGEATSMGPAERLEPEAVAQRRAAEQVGAWSSLTYGRGDVVRLGLPDGGLTVESVLAGLTEALRDLAVVNLPVEVYAAAHPDDITKDHLAVQQAVAACGVEVVRYLKDPLQSGGATGTHYPVDQRAAREALSAYWWTLGPRSSVAPLRNALVSVGFRSRYTR